MAICCFAILVKLSRWCGVLEVVGSAFEDTAPIFAEDNDPYTIRFNVRPLVMLDFDEAVPISQLWSRLSFTKNLVEGSVGWAQSAKLRQTLLHIGKEDGDLIARVLQDQASQPTKYPSLDAADLRHLGQRTVVRTEGGEVEVEVPEREEEPLPEHAPEIRASLKMQAAVAELGAALGFSLWVPPADRTKVLELVPDNYHSRCDCLAAAELRCGDAANNRKHRRFLIWLERRAIAHAVSRDRAHDRNLQRIAANG